MTFLNYHGEADDEHFEILRHILRSALVDRAAAERIVRTATVVARLYTMQLEAIDEITIDEAAIDEAAIDEIAIDEIAIGTASTDG